MLYLRMPIEKESPEEVGYDSIRYNLAESSVTDLKFEELNLDLNSLKLEYIAHRGNPLLRKEIVAGHGTLNENSVLVTNGAAGALFIINTALLNKEDHLIVLRPNYSTNIEVPKAIGCSITYIDLKFEEDWRVRVHEIANAVRTNTRLISITTPHNPTGMLMTGEERKLLIALAEQKNIFLLVDETYRDTCFKTSYPYVAAESKKVISVASLSKAYGLPGLRIGWLICQDDLIMERFLAAKEMIYISNSALDEEVSYQFLKQKDSFLKNITSRCQQNFTALQKWLHKENSLECVLPEGGVVCFPRFRNPEKIDTEKFYQELVQNYKTMVGPGHWFAMPDYYFRLGFGWVDYGTFTQGLENISEAIRKSEKV
ncbi:MAG: pyridoxal phosphate-dependent aminotransferase [Bacteroidetes bacterium]|nr:pyridoxal phosphate-dependent aminotransferase [Bacteroidota bacterium]